MAFVSKTDLRLFAAASAVAAWMALLFTGWALGGFVHGLLVLALLLVPWRQVPRSTTEVVDGSEHTVEEGGSGQPD